MSEKKPKLGIVSILNPSFLADLIEVQRDNFAAIHVVAPRLKKENEAVFFHPIRYHIGNNAITQTVNQIAGQLVISYNVARLSGQVDFWIFHGGDLLLLPMLAAKMTNSRGIILMAGNLEKEMEYRKSVLNPALRLLRKMNCALCDGIILYSNRMIEQWKLGRHRDNPLKHFGGILIEDRS